MGQNIAVLCSGISAAVLRENFKGIKECAVAHDCNVFVITCDNNSISLFGYGESDIYNAVDFSVFDGAIIMNNSFLDEKQMRRMEEILLQFSIPAVTVEGSHPKMFNFMIDNKRAMYGMMQHLIEDHHFRRICFVTGPFSNLEARDRLAAYEEAMREYGLAYEKEWIFEGTFYSHSGREAAEYFLNELPELPEAIVCSNDLEALGVQSFLDEQGIRVPDQVAVTGFDNIRQAKYYEPRLTTVSRENYRAGYAACAKLIEGITENEIGTAKTLETKLVLRESCGCQSNDVIDNSSFRKMHFDETQKNENYQTETSRLAVEMTTVENTDDIGTVLLPYLKRADCEEFYLCISNEWEGIHTENGLSKKYDMPEIKEDYIRIGYGTGTFLLMGYSKREQISAGNDFQLTDLVRSMRERQAGSRCYVIMPLHFKNRSFGYCIIASNEETLDSDLYYSWLINISNGLENIRKQNVMRAMINKLDSLWIYDSLTGLYNRSGFAKYAAQIWKECIRNGDTAGLFFIDLDGLKTVNDLYGHEAGDRFIKAVSEILTKNKRHGEAIMRFGGDEFVILTHSLDEKGTKEYCESLYREVDEYNRRHHLPYKMSISIGYHISRPVEGTDLETAIEAADANMYQVKREKGHSLRG